MHNIGKYLVARMVWGTSIHVQLGSFLFYGGRNTRQDPRFSIRMVIGIFCSDTETGAVTPPGVMQKK